MSSSYEPEVPTLNSEFLDQLTGQGAVDGLQTSKRRLSMIIPAYNEERRLLPTLVSIVEYFDKRGFSNEIIVVDDGSSDATADVARRAATSFHNIRLISLPRNTGKGAAVRTGMWNATGQYVLYSDADGATPVWEIERLLAAMAQGADVAIGSRALYSPETYVDRHIRRVVPGRIFAFLVKALVVPGIADTQCGFKMFRKDVARRIFEIQQLDGFSFDIEVLRIAWLLGYRIVEVPVNWADIQGSKVKLFRDSYRMLLDIFRVRHLTSISIGNSTKRSLGKSGM